MKENIVRYNKTLALGQSWCLGHIASSAHHILQKPFLAAQRNVAELFIFTSVSPYLLKIITAYFTLFSLQATAKASDLLQQVAKCHYTCM